MDSPLGYYNPNLRKQGAKTRALAAERSSRKTAEQDPRTFGFMSGLMGDEYGSSPLSVLDPKRAKSQTAQDIGMAIGTTLEAIPGVAALRKPVAKAGKALGKAALQQVNDANLYGEGPLAYFTPQVRAITPNAPKTNPLPSNASRHGKGWWYNTKNNVFMEIDSGSLGPHGDHDGWISVGDNAKKLGVDPEAALRYQEGTYGFMASKEDVQKAIKRGELQAKDVEKDGTYYYNKNFGDDVPTFDEAFEKKHGVSMEEAAFSGLPEELNSLVRIRQWPSGRISYSLPKEPNPRELQGIVNTMDKIPGFWKAPKVIALLDDGAYAYTLSPENFSRVRNIKDLPRFNDDILAKSSEVIPPLQQVAPPKPSPYTQEVLPTAEREANLQAMQAESAAPGDWYHGTSQDITQFKPKQAGATFLSRDPKFAEGFAEYSQDWMAKNAAKILTPEQLEAAKPKAIAAIKETYLDTMPEHQQALIESISGKNPQGEALDFLHNAYKDQLPSGPNIMKVQTAVENPWDYANPEHLDAVAMELNKRTDSYGQPLGNKMKPWLKTGQWPEVERPEVQDAIRALGYDAFYTREGSVKNLGVYDPAKIKSAYGNEGTYDISNPDITKKDGGSVKLSRYSKQHIAMQHSSRK